MADPFTDEDRARLKAMGRPLRTSNGTDLNAQTARAALAYITHLEGALREIANSGPAITTGTDRNAPAIARAALPTSKEDAG